MAKPWSKLPNISSTRTTIDPSTGKRRKREVISSAAFSGLQKAAAVLNDILEPLVEAANEVEDPPSPISADSLKQLLEVTQWPDERPTEVTHELALQLMHTFMEHLRQYSELLAASNERAQESEDERVLDRLDELMERQERVEELLGHWGSYCCTGKAVQNGSGVAVCMHTLLMDEDLMNFLVGLDDL